MSAPIMGKVAGATGEFRYVLVDDDGTVHTTGSATLTDASASGNTTNQNFQATTTSASKIAALVGRKYLFIQNQGTDFVYINFGAAAVADRTSIRIQPGASFVMEGSFIDEQAVHAISASGTMECAAREA